MHLIISVEVLGIYLEKIFYRTCNSWLHMQSNTNQVDLFLVTDVDDCLSPSKRLVVVLDKVPGLVSPSVKQMKSPESPQSRQNIPLSPVQLWSPSKSVVSSKPLTPKTDNSPMSPPSQPPSAAPRTPDRLATRTSADCRSPSRSAVKRLNMNSLLKSPRKPLLLSSPRRSPRKFSDENSASPQKDLRKAALSPLRFSSPSSLVSRLSMSSPSSCRKNLAVGLHKPDGKYGNVLSSCMAGKDCSLHYFT